MYVGHKNTNLHNVPPTVCKFMSGHIIFDIYFYFPRENFIFRLDVTPAARRLRRHHCLCRTLSLPAAATAGAAAACNRRTPYPAAAVADAFSDNNGETVVPSRGRLFNFIHALRPLIFHCLQFFSRSCQEGQIFRGRSLIVSLILSRIFSLYQQLSGKIGRAHV